MSRRWVISLLGVYVVVATVVAVRSANQINPDGVVYLRIASYYLEGDLSRAVSGYWSPLYSWLLMPWLAAGVPGMLATKLLGVLLALAWLMGLWMIGRRHLVHSLTRGLMLLGAAVMVLPWLLQIISPDLLLASLLTYYFVVASDPRSIHVGRRAFACGVLGGLAYLAKAYALPFLVVHFAGSVVLHAWAEAWRGGGARYCRAVLAAAGGFLVVAGPWVAVLSRDYGSLKFTTASSLNLSVLQVATVERMRAAGVEEGRLTSWEAPDRLPELRRAPAGGGRTSDVMNWARYLANGVAKTRGWVAAFDYFHFAWAGILGLALLGLLRRSERTDRTRYVWIPFTVGLYVAGYIPLAASEGRYYWPVVGLMMIATFAVGEQVADAMGGGRAGEGVRRMPAVAVSVVVALSYLLVGTQALIRLYNTPRPDYGSLAGALRPVLADGGGAPRGAVAGNDWEQTLYVGYALGVPVHAGSGAQESDGLAEDLRRVGVRTFLVFDDPVLAEQLGRTGRFRRVSTLVVQERPSRSVSAFEVDARRDGR